MQSQLKRAAQAFRLFAAAAAPVAETLKTNLTNDPLPYGKGYRHNDDGHPVGVRFGTWHPNPVGCTGIRIPRWEAPQARRAA